MKWNKVENQNDIDLLIEKAYGFHDSFISKLKYKSGIVQDGKKTIFCGANHHVLEIEYESPWFENILVLRFIGVNKFNIKGCEEDYLNDIFDCSLFFSENKTICWANYEGFDMKSPDGNYAIANHLEWRFKNKQEILR